MPCPWPGAAVPAALVRAVVTAASQAGAIRVSVQTEPANTAALQLYRTSGFVSVDDLQILLLGLPLLRKAHQVSGHPCTSRTGEPLVPEDT
jgi:hypothetical protein